MVIRKTIVKRSNPKKKVLLWAGITVGILAVALAISEVTNTTYLLHERKAVSSTIAQASSTKPKDKHKNDDDKTSAPSTPTPTPAPTESSTSAPKEGDTTSNPPTGAPLVEPYGNFVSNHAPGKNGSPSIETSVCLTTPGAKCYIAFTSKANPAIVKTLAAGTADSSGAVYWNNWDVRAAGFTNGIWEIKAVATLNGQTKTTIDTVNFEVQL